MAARITRAKRKIRVANIPYRVPEGDELPARLEQVLVRRPSGRLWRVQSIQDRK